MRILRTAFGPNRNEPVHFVRFAKERSTGGGGIKTGSSGTLDRIASHITSPAIALRSRKLRLVLETSSVERAKIVSHSTSAEKVWMPRAIDVWTFTASPVKASYL